MEDLDALVAAAQTGGNWAFARIWEELSGSVSGYLRARGVAEYEDATSEVFLAAFQGIRQFQGNGRQFRSWLFTIAHHHGVDGLRRQRRSLREIDFNPDLHDHSVDSAEHLAMMNEGAAEMIELLKGLTAEQREVLLLRFVADLSLDEVAAITGRRVGGVKQLQRRGIDALRRHLNGPSSAAPISPYPVISITESR